MFTAINAGRVAVVSSLSVGLVMIGALVSGASAAPPAAVTDAIDDVAADLVIYGGALVGLVVVAIGFMIGIKYLRKARSAA